MAGSASAGGACWSLWPPPHPGRGEAQRPTFALSLRGPGVPGRGPRRQPVVAIRLRAPWLPGEGRCSLRRPLLPTTLPPPCGGPGAAIEPCSPGVQLGPGALVVALAAAVTCMQIVEPSHGI